MRREQPVYEDDDGQRVSSYEAGRHDYRGKHLVGYTYTRRWEHWACEPGQADVFMESHGWVRVPVPGKTWRSGNQAYTIARAW